MSKAAVKKQHENLPQQYENVWLEVAAEAGSETGKLLKFVKGAWCVGDDEIPSGTEFICHIDKLIRGWVRFEDSRVVDRVVGKVADGFKPPPREELSDADPKSWREKDADGRPRDPWAEQWFLPLISVETGELLTYVTGSRGGIGAIADLCRVYGHGDRHGMLPIIAVKTRSYKHKTYGRIETPDFQIVGWDGGEPTKTAPAMQRIPSKADADNADMDFDSIPFDEVPPNDR